MKRLVLIATLATLAVAKPGLYKEKEDFQYSRSSTDEGSKAGYYGAQRGNMGGNYERAHNMDGLAQNQMSGLVRQVEGELGDGSRTRTGSVFTAANSRGIYGSGRYDLKNLEGRNFQEGVAYDDSQSLSQTQSHSSLTAQSGYNAESASALNSAAYMNRQSYGSQSQGGYDGYQYLGHNGAESNLQQTQNLHAANQYDYGGQAATGYFSQSAHNGQSAYDQTQSYQNNENSYGLNAQTRLRSTMPVKVVIRPGTKVAVPVAAETYDASNSAAYDHNSVNSEAELLTNKNLHNSNYKPSGAKHYESSYSYRKQWEKHDALPVTVQPVEGPTANPFPINSELHEDAQSLSAGQQYQSTGVGSQRSHSHSSHSYGGYNADVNSASSSHSHHQNAYNAQHHSSASSAASDYGLSSQGTYNAGVGADTNNQIEDISNKPKSYHSSYSYHKSWERQGDPYIIKPASSGYRTKASERLTADSNNQGAWSSHSYGSRHNQGQQHVLNLEDCDEHGHIRVARSYNTIQHQQQSPYQRHQYTQDQEVLSQQSQNLEDLTQQSQNQWDKIEDLGQQSQNKWDQSEDLTQQSQNKWDPSQDMTQQSENKWDQSQDLSQQSQNKWDQSEDLTQQSQNKWDQSEDLTQQSHNKWDQSQDLSQQSQNKWDQSEDLTQQSQNKWDQTENLGQQTQNQWDKLEDGGQQTQTQWEHFDGQQSRLDDGQQLQSTWETSGIHDVGQETEVTWGNNKKPSVPNSEIEENHFNPHGSNSPKDFPERPQNPWSADFNRHNNNNKYWEHPDNGNFPIPTHNHFNHPFFSQYPYTPERNEQFQSNNNYNQQFYNNAWSSVLPSFSGSQSHNTWDEYSTNHHHTTDIKPSNRAEDTPTLWNLWNKVDTIEKQTISSNKNKTEESQQSVGDNDGIQNKPFTHQDGHFWGPQEFNVETSTGSSTSTTKKIETSTISATSTIINKKPQEGKSPVSDVGRGDIGPEDSDNDNKPQSNTQETSEEFGIQFKPVIFVAPLEHRRYKTPAEIEALSQVIPNDKRTIDSTENFKEISFTDRPHQQPTHIPSVQSSTTLRSIIGVTESDAQYQNMAQYSGNTVTIEDGKHTESNQPTWEQRDNQLVQQSEHFDQENVQQQFTSEIESHKIIATDVIPTKIEIDNKPINVIEKDKTATIQNGTVNKKNIFHKTLPPLQQNNMEIPNYPLWDRLDNGNSHMTAIKVDDYPLLHQPQITQSTSQTQITDNNNRQSNIYNDQKLNNGQGQNFDQQNTDQEFENFEQQSDNLKQQRDNLHEQFENYGEHKDLGQQSVNFDQQFDSFGQQRENLGQQNEQFDQKFENFGEHSNNLGQQSEKFDQKFENFEQSENLGQDNEKFDQQFESLGQLSENLGQQSEKFDQEFENFGQQNENLGQQSENFGQQFESFGQQSETFENKDLVQKTDEQFETFWKKLDNKNVQDAQQEQINLSTPNKYSDSMNPDLSLVEPVHKINNIKTSSGGNSYNEEQSKNWNQNEDLGQQVQTDWEQPKNLDEIQNLQVIPVEKLAEKLEIPEDRAIKTETATAKDLLPTTLSTPPETDKDNPGFWKSVGNKFVNAKDKVFSWFSSS